MLKQVLLVDSDAEGAGALARLLDDGGYAVAVVGSFEVVCALAAKRRPDLVMTAVRLGRFNGLHLAARFRGEYPGLPLILLGDEDEVALAADAIKLEARFVPKSTPGPELLQYVDALVAGRAPRDLVSTRRWPRRPSTFVAQLMEFDARVTDVGYGGLRLECECEPCADEVVEIMLPAVGMRMKGTLRWGVRRAGDQLWAGGVELDTATLDAKKWRQVVDSLTA